MNYEQYRQILNDILDDEIKTAKGCARLGAICEHDAEIVVGYLEERRKTGNSGRVPEPFRSSTPLEIVEKLSELERLRPRRIEKTPRGAVLAFWWKTLGRGEFACQTCDDRPPALLSLTIGRAETVNLCLACARRAALALEAAVKQGGPSTAG